MIGFSSSACHLPVPAFRPGSRCFLVFHPTCGDRQKDYRKPLSYQRGFSCPCLSPQVPPSAPFPASAALGLAVPCLFMTLTHAFFPAFLFSSMSPGAWIRWFHLRLAFVTLSIPSLPHRSAPPVAPVGVPPAPPIMGVVDSSLAGKPSELSGWRGAASLDCWAAWSWGHGLLVVLRWRSPSIAPLI